MKKIIALLMFSFGSLSAMNKISDPICIYTIIAQIQEDGCASLTDLERQQIKKFIGKDLEEKYVKNGDSDKIIATERLSEKLDNFVRHQFMDIDPLKTVVNRKKAGRDYWQHKACFGELGLFRLPISKVETDYNNHLVGDAGPSAFECMQMINQMNKEEVAYSGRTWFLRIAAGIAIGAIIVNNQK